jgi:hypothetical protein
MKIFALCSENILAKGKEEGKGGVRGVRFSP